MSTRNVRIKQAVDNSKNVSDYERLTITKLKKDFEMSPKYQKCDCLQNVIKNFEDKRSWINK